MHQRMSDQEGFLRAMRTLLVFVGLLVFCSAATFAASIWPVIGNIALYGILVIIAYLVLQRLNKENNS